MNFSASAFALIPVAVSMPLAFSTQGRAARKRAGTKLTGHRKPPVQQIGSLDAAALMDSDVVCAAEQHPSLRTPR